MLFNTPEFILFLASMLLIYFGVSKFCSIANCDPIKPSLILLLLGATYFYSQWDHEFAVLLAALLVVTFVCAKLILKLNDRSISPRIKFMAFVIIMALVISPMAYYKYSYFIIQNYNAFFNQSICTSPKILPLGISFFTFTLLSFVVDVYKRRLTEFGFMEFSTTVTYFPHLVAGPILLHHDMLPQLTDKETYKFNDINLVVGFSMFCLGLFKKVYLADSISPFVGQVFDAVAAGQTPDAGASWLAALCYTLQLYFDFSGYSDMAIGISTMFGLMIPANFYSPYKSASIIDFWRRWHISLAAFLREYVYFPLGGNRKGEIRKYLNLVIVMFLCGVWHGAGWTFILWGCYHAVLLVLNHFWRHVKQVFQFSGNSSIFWTYLSIVITFLCIIVGWVIFRADSVQSALVLLKGMFGLNASNHMKFRFVGAEKLIALQLAIVFLLPNSHQIFSKFRHALHVPDAMPGNWFRKRLVFSPNRTASLVLTIALFCLTYRLVIGESDKIFLYCQF